MTLFIPLVTSTAGQTLTYENWQTAGVKTLALSLAHLLVKPGINVLKEASNLRNYLGFDGEVVLNAALKPNEDGHYLIRSSYDGSTTRYTLKQLMDLIILFKADKVIFPSGAFLLSEEIQQKFEHTMLFFPWAEKSANAAKESGVYLEFPDEAYLLNEAVLDKCPLYVAGSLPLAMMMELKCRGVHYLQSDEPAAQAVLGYLYTKEGELCIKDPSHAMAFKPIDDTCGCVTCLSHFTKAYLHHLYQHTPLLCQRLLVQHNVFFSSQCLQP